MKKIKSSTFFEIRFFMVTYSVEEDRLLLQLRDDLSSPRGPDWNSIKNRFNVEFGGITYKKYTVAMLRNRLARIEKSRFNLSLIHI